MSERKTSRPVWSGTLKLGAVEVAVNLHVAQQRDEISLRTLHRDCATPIKQKRWCPDHNRELESGETVKGYEYAPGRFVTIDDTEPPAAKTCELAQIVPAAEVPALQLDRSYFVEAADDEQSRRGYAVLQAAFERTRLAGIGNLTMYGKEHVCAIRPLEGGLVATTLYLAEDIRPWPRQRPEPARESEIRLAAKLLRERATPFTAAKLRLRSRVTLRAKIDQAVTAASGALADALRQSVSKPHRRKAAAK